jgi:hypothetical protein
MPKKQPIPDKILESFFNDIDSVRHKPRFQIIVTSGYLELLVNTLIEHKCKSNGSKKFNYAPKLVLLHEMGIISKDEFEILNAFRELRNEAAHVAQFTLTAQMIAPFKASFKRNKSKQLFGIENFQRICHLTLGEFWNAHTTVFHPYFNPEQIEEEERDKAEAKRQKLIFDSLQ